MDKGLALWFGSIVLHYFSEIAILHTHPTIPSISLGIEGISLLFCIFQGGLFFDFPQDPGFDPYREMSR